MSKSYYGWSAAALATAIIALTVAATAAPGDGDQGLSPAVELPAPIIHELKTAPFPYTPLGAPVPEVVAEEILQLRDVLGTGPIVEGDAFRPLPIIGGGAEELPPPHDPAVERNVLGAKIRLMARSAMERGAQAFQSRHEQPPRVLTTCVLAQGADERVNILRQTAQQLEHSAHLLECQDLYEQADGIRRQANQLRADARALKVGETAATDAWEDKDVSTCCRASCQAACAADTKCGCAAKACAKESCKNKNCANASCKQYDADESAEESAAARKSKRTPAEIEVESETEPVAEAVEVPQPDAE